jgi:hypothetical protein
MVVTVRIVTLMPEQAVAGGANQEQGKEEHLKRQIQQNL